MKTTQKEKETENLTTFKVRYNRKQSRYIFTTLEGKHSKRVIKPPNNPLLSLNQIRESLNEAKELEHTTGYTLLMCLNQIEYNDYRRKTNIHDQYGDLTYSKGYTPTVETIRPLSYHVSPELRTLKIKPGYNTPYEARLYAKPTPYSYRYKAKSKTRIPVNINQLPIKYAKGFIPKYSKLLFRCPICRKTRTLIFKDRELSTPTHTHKNRKISMYLVRLKIDNITLYEYDLEASTLMPDIINLDEINHVEEKPLYDPPVKRKYVKTPPLIDTPQIISQKLLNQKYRKENYPEHYTKKLNKINRVGIRHTAPYTPLKGDH